MTIDPAVVIRPAVKGDYPQIRYIRELVLEKDSANNDELEAARSPAWEKLGLELVALLNGKIVGHVVCGPVPVSLMADVPEGLDLGGFVLHEMGIATLPEHRGLGIGKQLLERAMAQGRRLGFKACFATPRSAESYLWFNKNGFVSANTLGIKPGGTFEQYSRLDWFQQCADVVLLVRELR